MTNDILETPEAKAFKISIKQETKMVVEGLGVALGALPRTVRMNSILNGLISMLIHVMGQAYGKDREAYAQAITRVHNSLKDSNKGFKNVKRIKKED